MGVQAHHYLSRRQMHLALDPVHHGLVLLDAGIDEQIELALPGVIVDAAPGDLVILHVSWHNAVTLENIPERVMTLVMGLERPQPNGRAKRRAVNQEAITVDPEDADLGLGSLLAGSLAALIERRKVIEHGLGVVVVDRALQQL